MTHIPVLCRQVVEYLAIQPDDVVLDGTIGFGGHASALLAELGPKGTYIGLDQDSAALSHCAEQFEADERVHLFGMNYEQFELALDTLGLTHIDKVLIDIGMSSFQLDLAQRGFSFSGDEPLDMRMNPDQDVTAADLVNTLPADALSDIFFQFGELHQNKRLVSAILESRPILTSAQLVELIKRSYFFNHNRRVFIKTASQVFQALRIAVNRELEVLDSFLNRLSPVMTPGGRVAVITFHSLEDRLVKQFFKRHSDRFHPLHKRVLTADETELTQNSRAHSAKLRVVEIC